MTSEFVVRVPDVGEGVAEAELVGWHVEVGDTVSADQPIVDVLTDKATVEIPSPVDGVIVWRAGEAGEVVAVGSDLVRIDRDGSAAGGGGAAAATDESAPASAATPGDDESSAPGEIEPDDTAAIGPDGVDEIASADEPDQAANDAPAASERSGATAPEPTTAPTAPAATPARQTTAAGGAGAGGRRQETSGSAHHDVDARPQASPAVRRRALDAGIDLRQVAGSGPAGRVGHEDLDAFLTGSRRLTTAGASPFVAAPDEAVEEPIIGVRRKIAERLGDTARRIPHITYVDDVDLTPLQELRAAINADADAPADRPRLTFLPFLVRAVVSAVQAFPQFNARFDDGAGVLHKHRAVHLGIAAQTPRGLMVPVLRHAEGHDVFAAAAEIERLANAARDGSIGAGELSGSTITISSLGALGGLVSTPIINSPEVAIIGVNKLEQRPVWDGTQFVPRATMNLSSSFDHRIIDGWDAAQFIQHVKAKLQAPALLLI